MQMINSQVAVLPVTPKNQESREKQLELALHDVYDGLMLALTTARIVGNDDEEKIRGAIRKAQYSYKNAMSI